MWAVTMMMEKTPSYFDESGERYVRGAWSDEPAISSASSLLPVVRLALSHSRYVTSQQVNGWRRPLSYSSSIVAIVSCSQSIVVMVAVIEKTSRTYNLSATPTLYFSVTDAFADARYGSGGRHVAPRAPPAAKEASSSRSL
jgi:hypothetical protein